MGKKLNHIFEKKQYVLEELEAKESWRLFKIIAEFVEGFDELSALYPAITIFGSARIKPDDEDYQKAEKVARLLVEAGFSIITGGGPGIMEAANKGAAEAGGFSAGLNIKLPFEQEPNPYANIKLEFRYFFVRKVLMAKYSVGFIFFPGGYGTLDELFEILTLIQTKKIRPVPVVLVNSSYWVPLKNWIEEHLLATKKIEPHDLKIFVIEDEPKEVVKYLKECAWI